MKMSGRRKAAERIENKEITVDEKVIKNNY